MGGAPSSTRKQRQDRAGVQRTQPTNPRRASDIAERQSINQTDQTDLALQRGNLNGQLHGSLNPAQARKMARASSAPVLKPTMQRSTAEQQEQTAAGLAPWRPSTVTGATSPNRRRWRECIYCKQLLNKNATPENLLNQELAGFVHGAPASSIEPGVCDECFNFWNFASAEFRLPNQHPSRQSRQAPWGMQQPRVVRVGR